jgi:hypothetical protein
MPNGGLTPDCVHCKLYRGAPFSHAEPFCARHKMTLPYPIRAFCASYRDPEPNPKDWLDQVLDRKQLRQDMMYLWLGDNGAGFYHVPLALIAEYKDWTSEQFLDEVGRLTDEYSDRTIGDA